jgi:hypothetical protein
VRLLEPDQQNQNTDPYAIERAHGVMPLFPSLFLTGHVSQHRILHARYRKGRRETGENHHDRPVPSPIGKSKEEATVAGRHDPPGRTRHQFFGDVYIDPACNVHTAGLKASCAFWCMCILIGFLWGKKPYRVFTIRATQKISPLRQTARTDMYPQAALSIGQSPSAVYARCVPLPSTQTWPCISLYVFCTEDFVVST